MNADQDPQPKTIQNRSVLKDTIPTYKRNLRQLYDGLRLPAILDCFQTVNRHVISSIENSSLGFHLYVVPVPVSVTTLPTYTVFGKERGHTSDRKCR
jgi:hypothetical protein